MGTTGEGPSLSCPQKEKLVAQAAEIINERLPLLVGISDTVVEQTISLGRFAASQNAAALVLAPPAYFPLTQDEFFAYLSHVASQLPLPIILYNMPTHTHFQMSLETIMKAAQIKNVIGLKDSSGDMFFFQRVKYALQHTDFQLFVGPEELLGEAILAGAHGGVSGGANVFPHLYVAMYKAANEGDFKHIRKLQKRIMQIRDELYSIGHTSAALIQVYKCCLAAHGIINSDALALPYRNFTGEQKERACQAFQKIMAEL